MLRKVIGLNSYLKKNLEYLISRVFNNFLQKNFNLLSRSVQSTIKQKQIYAL